MARAGVVGIETQLRLDEKEVLHAYQDHLGYWTIGVGRLIDARRGGGLTREESAYLLRNDIRRVTETIEEHLPWYNLLSTPRQGVLLNMAFQMGAGGLFGFVNTLRLIKEARYIEAAAAMLQSSWAQQTPERARRLSEQMRTGVWQ
jgi:lysozyme